MGIQLKLLFSDSKDQLNIVVEDYDKSTKTVSRTMLDIVVDLEKKNHVSVSDIDEEDLNAQNDLGWNCDDLEKVLGPELGIEISNITGNAEPFQAASNDEKSDSAIADVVSLAQKCKISDQDEEEILNADFTNMKVGKNVTNEETALKEASKPDEDMIESTILDEDAVLSMTNTHAENKDPSAPSTSGTSTKKNNCEIPKSSEERAKSLQSDDCEFVIEEVNLDDILEESDRWSVGNHSDNHNEDPKIVDLTDLDNVDCCSVHTHSIPSSDDESGSVTVLHDYPDDDDEVCSQYSSARPYTRRRTESDGGHRHSDLNFVPPHRARSEPPENLVETIYDWDDDDVPVIDLTSGERVECVDLTERNNGKSGRAAQYPLVIRRSPEEVMKNNKNFYSSNKAEIAAKRNALLAFAQSSNKRSGIEAPPKLNNGLPHRKRCCPVSHESDIKFSRTARSPGLRERNGNDDQRQEVTPLNKDVPKPTYGPPGFRLNDDMGNAYPVEPKEENIGSPGNRPYQRRNFNGRGSRQFNFRENRRGGRTPLTEKNKFYYPRKQGKRYFKRFNQNHISPLRRQNYIQRTSDRGEAGEVWLDLKDA